MKLTNTKSWARNILMLDFTFVPSFKFKQWFTGFGVFSFRWIQICIGSSMRRSSYLFTVHIFCVLKLADSTSTKKVVFS